MGKASSGKKVARAAGTGGGRTSRGRTPWGWYSAIAVVVSLGLVVLVASRNETQERVSARGDEHPTTKEHWHAAYGFFICDNFVSPLADNGRDPLGIHTHGDGVIHVHPFSQAASGARAVADQFFRAMGITVTRSRIEIGDSKWAEGKDKCGGEPGVVRVLVNGKELQGDPGTVHFEDNQLIVFAFAAEDTEIPPTPPSSAQLNQLTDVPGSPGATSSTSQLPSDSTTTSTPPAGGGTTSSSTP